MKWITLALLLIAAASSAAQSLDGGTTQGGNDPETPLAAQRAALAAQLRALEGVGNRVADAFAAVPREDFVPPYLRSLAYRDSSLPLGDGRALPSPSDLALAIAALDPRASDRILVYGESDGYAAALLAHLASRVEDVELDAAQVSADRRILSTLGYANVTLSAATPLAGLRERFDRILVNGAVTSLPAALTGLLSPNGRLVAPLSDPSGVQMLVSLQNGKNGSVTLDGLGRAFFPPIRIPSGP